MKFKKTLSFGEFFEDGPISNDDGDILKFSVFSDLHYGYRNYNVFNCLEGKNKLERILSDTSDSSFILNLGDYADNLESQNINPYIELDEVIKKHSLEHYLGKDIDGKRMMYSVIGNHEAAYMPKKALKDYTPYTKEGGNSYVFKRDHILFVAYDALFSIHDKKDEPSSIIKTLEYILPKSITDYIDNVISKIDLSDVSMIVGFSHICCKRIEKESFEYFLTMLSKYSNEIYIFEGHAHMENFQLFEGEGATIRVFTLPAVTDYNTYNYYEVFVKDNRIIRINQIERDL